MSVALLEGAGRRFHNRQVLAVWTAVSVAVHAAILLALPAMRLMERTPLEPLDVRLEKIEPPRPIPPERVSPPASRTQPKRAPREKIVKAPPPAAPAAREVPREPVREPPRELPRTAPAPVLVAPEPPSIAAPSVPAPSVPQPENPPAGPPAAQMTERQQPPARAAQRGDKGAELVPPSFSASYLNNPKPRYPLSARRRGTEGTVVLRVLVTADGFPRRVIVQTSSGSNALDTVAAEEVKNNWRFVPARRGTQAVEEWVDVPIVFKLEG